MSIEPRSEEEKELRRAEIRRRQKLLYGVKDVKTLINKSEDSKNILNKHISKSLNEHEDSDSEKDNSTSSNGPRRWQDYIKAEYFIIPIDSSWKTFFDTFTLIIVTYSIFTTLYYVSFSPPTRSYTMYILDEISLYVFVLDFIFNFFVEYQDQETFLMIKDHKKIAQRYLFSGFLIFDFLATFPINKIVDGPNVDPLVFQSNNKSYITKLFRLTRLTRVYMLLDQSRVNRAFKQIFESSQRQDRIVAQYILLYGFKIFRLIIIAIFNTYLCGCVWYMICLNINDPKQVEERQTFLTYFNIDKIEDPSTQMIISCYFALTTLSTVGYGDLYPISYQEQIAGIFVMLLGIVFFSHIMGSFIEIISNYDKRMGSVDRGTELHNWMTLLTRFTNNKPLPKTLINQIDNHFAFYWANDRLNAISKDDEFLAALPRQIKRHIIKHYLFDDIFFRFRLFFNTQENKDSKFLYDISFGLKPRKFDTSEEERLILDEEDDVSEMYFITEGIVGIGYYLMTQGLSKKQYKLGIYMKAHSFICDYYVCYNKKSEFIFMVVQEVKAFSLSKKFLLQNIFVTYPYIAATIKKGCSDRYKKNVRARLLKYREEHIAEINKKSSYKYIDIMDKNDYNKLNQNQQPKVGLMNNLGISQPPAYTAPQANVSAQQEIKMHKNETDLNQILKKRIEGIQFEMSKFNNFINEFAITADNELINLVGNINLLQRNIINLNYQKKDSAGVKNDRQDQNE